MKRKYCYLNNFRNSIMDECRKGLSIEYVLENNMVEMINIGDTHRTFWKSAVEELKNKGEVLTSYGKRLKFSRLN